MKKILNYTLLFFLFSFVELKAQATESKPDVVNGLSSLSVLTPRLSYEMRVGHLQTIVFSAGLNSFSSPPNNFNYDAGVSYRYFYNLEKRNLDLKNTNNNSANYFALKLERSMNTAATWKNSVDITPLWGIQRNFNSHFSLGLAIGPSLMIRDNSVKSVLTGELHLGFHFGKTK